MTDGTGAPGTSLVGVAAADKAVLDGVIGDPNGIYHRGTADMDAKAVQQYYQDLVRGELEGADGALAPPGGADVDLPRTPADYRLSEISGARSATAEDRDIIDRFLPAAHAAGLGQRKVAEGIGFALTHQVSPTIAEEFVAFARARAWSEQQIGFALDWVADFDPSAAAPAPRAEGGKFLGKAAAADERAEIEKIIGDPASEYWRGPKANAMQARYRELIAAGA